MNDISGSHFGKTPDTDTSNESGHSNAAAGQAVSINALQALSQNAAVARGVKTDDQRLQRLHKRLRATLGEDVYSSWFNALELVDVDGDTLRLSVPVRFLKTWIQGHFSEQLLAGCKAEFEGVDRIDLVTRELGAPAIKAASASVGEARQEAPSARPAPPAARPMAQARSLPAQTKTSAGGVDGSPLDPRYTFDSFVVGATNRMAHAGARQVAETVFGEQRSFNPLFIHANVGLGKTHLLHAIAWEVRRRHPHAQVLYLTAERFRLQFVDALRGPDPMAFKERFRHADMLLIDDLEFLSGQQTEQEFDHVINTLLDAGRPVAVASSRPPSAIERLNERMRSRLSRGLVTEIKPLDQELRLRVLERRVSERRSIDPSFEVSADILELLAERLNESGRELEGAVTRLHCQWQYMKTALTFDMAETLVRDLTQGTEPRRIKIEDIIKVVARFYTVGRTDLLSQRRHRSVVWPRQIGMYLAKQMTARSLPEIGRRFGNRDHTTVLHAIRKVDALLPTDPKLRAEIEELKKQINA